jgi:UDP-N-acetylmuramoyl-tripeptide--D-alanyl-D-alanine ligase
MKIKDIYNLYSKHYLVYTDTRNIRKNTLFFALKGDNFNGNKFAEKALKLGANFAIVDEGEYNTHPNIILVDNVLKSLQQLANFHRNTLNIPIIGLTGSNGKTTTKELINAVLSKKYKTTATKGNLNNHIGVPLTLLSMTPEILEKIVSFVR